MSVKVNSTTVNDVYLNRNVGYTIVGSPTIVNGVVSGFSADDYCDLSQTFHSINDNIKTIDIATKITTGTIGTAQGVIANGTYGNSALGFFITSAGKPTLMIYYYNGTTNVNSQNNSSITCEANTVYYLKGVINFETGENTLSVSTDNTNWTTTTKTPSNYVNMASANYRYRIGKTQSGVFTGSIDLNNTYIKLNGVTFFNGKETASSTVNEVYYNKNCGYTVVGSPTIVDGVASGFSQDNRLLTTSTLEFSKSMNFEFGTKIKLSEIVINNTFFGTYGSYGAIFLVSNKGKLYCGFGNGSSSFPYDFLGSTTLSLNTNYWIKVIISNQIMSAYLSQDGQNYNLEGSIALGDNILTSSYNISFGVGRISSTYFRGSIDFNSTYIKVNGITWFNGKQQASNAVWTRGA